jgi:hypothetical protein
VTYVPLTTEGARGVRLWLFGIFLFRLSQSFAYLVYLVLSRPGVISMEDSMAGVSGFRIVLFRDFRASPLGQVLAMMEIR